MRKIVLSAGALAGYEDRYREIEPEVMDAVRASLLEAINVRAAVSDGFGWMSPLGRSAPARYTGLGPRVIVISKLTGKVWQPETNSSSGFAVLFWC
jgi:hypothetical protein